MIAAAALFFAAAAAGAETPACDPSASSQTVTFVHVTDLHANYHPRPDGASPYARIRGKFEEIRRLNPAALFIDGGDDHEKGSVAETLSNGAATREATRAMRFDVRVLGNHDFAFGETALLEHARDPQAAVLASNMRRAKGSALAFGATAYAELQVGCARVGFLGLITQPWNEKDEPFDGEYPGFRGEYDYAAVAFRILASRRVKPDLTVLVSHLGREDDLKLAGRVQGIDLILGGHTHGVTWEPIMVGRTRVVESGGYAEFLTRVDATVDLASHRVLSWNHDLMRVDDGMPVDPGVEKETGRIMRKYLPPGSSPAGCACRAADPRSAAAAAARAAAGVLGVDAAVADLKNVWTPWSAGPLGAQALSDAFKIEREPPGTPGFSAFYIAQIDGAALASLRAKRDAARWVYVGPDAPQAGKPYRLALPKRAALHPEDFFGAGIALGTPRFSAEVWEVLERYARSRAEKGLCVDGACGL